MNKERYYRIVRDGIQVTFRKTKYGRDKIVSQWTEKGYDVKVDIVYM